MSAINLTYNSALNESIIMDNEILLKKKNHHEIVYKFPIPRKFRIIKILEFMGEGLITYVMTPYQPNFPEFIPPDFKNVAIGPDGLYHALKECKLGEIRMTYIDTRLLTPQSYNYPTNGKVRMSKNSIPNPFWMPYYQDFYIGWTSINKIPEHVKSFDQNARLITESELLSVFALNYLEMEFFEYISENSIDTFKCNNQYLLNLYCFDLDNWDMIVSSEKKANIYKLMHRERARNFYEQFWYRNKYVTLADNQIYAFHIFPVLDEKSITRKRKIE